MNEDQLSLEDEVKAFLGLATHEEKCVYFNAHPELERIFAAHHFPKPDRLKPGLQPSDPKADKKTTVPKPK